jgi:uncharacterized protein (TIGR02452 family)
LGLLLEKKKYPIPSDGLHYIKNVLITKDLSMVTIAPIQCAVIASELNAICERKDSYLVKRIDDFYTIALQNKHNVIILGAIGCGAFKESDDDVVKLARIMRLCADRYANKIKTVFAVYRGKENYIAFCNAMILSI